MPQRHHGHFNVDRVGQALFDSAFRPRRARRMRRKRPIVDGVRGVVVLDQSAASISEAEPLVSATLSVGSA